MSYRILIVDDDFANLRLLTRLLEPMNANLSLASNAGPAFALLQTEGHEYDLILLERCLPGSDGLALLTALKRDSRFAHIPVIMQTASAAPEQVAEGLLAGAAYYVAKPIQGDLLAALVRSALAESADRRSLNPGRRRESLLLETMQEAEFQFRTLEEARALASELSGLCPEPERVALGLSELMVNAVEHGNLEISYAEKSELCRSNGWQSEVERRLGLPQYRARTVRLRVTRCADSIQFLVRDDGPGFSFRDFLQLDPARAFAPNGRGIALARELAFSCVEYQAPGNSVVASVELDPKS